MMGHPQSPDYIWRTNHQPALGFLFEVYLYSVIQGLFVDLENIIALIAMFERFEVGLYASETFPGDVSDFFQVWMNLSCTGRWIYVRFHIFLHCFSALYNAKMCQHVLSTMWLLLLV